MIILQFSNIEHYDILKDWWRGHGQPPIREDVLPSTGYIVAEGDRMLCAGFLYEISEVDVGFAAWIVSNPDNTPRLTHSAVSSLICAMKERSCYRMIFASTESKAIAKIYESHGFVVGDRNVTNLVWGA